MDDTGEYGYGRGYGDPGRSGGGSVDSNSTMEGGLTAGEPSAMDMERSDSVYSFLVTQDNLVIPSYYSSRPSSTLDQFPPQEHRQEEVDKHKHHKRQNIDIHLHHHLEQFHFDNGHGGDSCAAAADTNNSPSDRRLFHVYQPKPKREENTQDAPPADSDPRQPLAELSASRSTPRPDDQQQQHHQHQHQKQNQDTNHLQYHTPRQSSHSPDPHRRVERESEKSRSGESSVRSSSLQEKHFPEYSTNDPPASVASSTRSSYANSYQPTPIAYRSHVTPRRPQPKHFSNLSTSTTFTGYDPFENYAVEEEEEDPVGRIRESIMSEATTTHFHSSQPPSVPHSDPTTTQADYSYESRLESVPEADNRGAPSVTPTTSCPPPSTMSNASLNTSLPRTRSIDSSLSASSSGPSQLNPLSNIKGDSPTDIQAIIRAAGSPEEAIKHLIKDKQNLTAQNGQLWKLVDKQRTMILGLNKDLERALKEKERYRRKFSQHSTIPSRSVSESPAPSLDESRYGGHSPADSARSESVPLVARDQQVSPTTTLEHVAPFNAAPSPTDRLYSSNGKVPSSHHMSHRSNQNNNGAATGVSQADSALLPLQSNSAGHSGEHGSTKVDAEMREQKQHENEYQPALPVSTGPADAPESFYRDTSIPNPNAAIHQPQISSPPPKLMDLQNKEMASPGLSSPPLSPPGMGSGKSRRPKPAPLELSNSEEWAEMQGFASIEERTTAIREEAPQQMQQRTELMTSFPVGAIADKTAEAADEPRRVSVPTTRVAPAPIPAITEIKDQQAPSSIPRNKQQFARNGLASPGLPSSPRPIDRPPNSPMPRRSLDQVAPNNASGSRGHLGTGSLSSLSNVVSASSLPDQHTRNSSLGSIPQGAELEVRPKAEPAKSATSTHSDSSIVGPSPQEYNRRMALNPAAIDTVEVTVVSSRLRPSRMSMMTGKGNAGDQVFTLGVVSKLDKKEIVRVEKDVYSLHLLDSKIRRSMQLSVSVPDKSLFSGHAPAKIDARRQAIDTYFRDIFDAQIDERAAQVLCDFFSADVLEGSPAMDGSMRHSPKDADGSIGSKVVKEGYLTKRGKNFGGWKERYFVLDGPVLKYFDGLGGAHLGQIKLQHAQIGRQSAQPKREEGPVDEETQYRHAFLVLEPKKKDSTTLVRHVLCAESDAERDEWVDALLMFVERPSDKKDSSRPTTRGGQTPEKTPPVPTPPAAVVEEAKQQQQQQQQQREQQNDDSSLRAIPYEDANAGPIPARGPTPEDMRRNASPSPSSAVSTHSQTFSSHAPIPERGPVSKQISAPQGGTVISDLSAWGSGGKKPNQAATDKALKKRSIFSFGNSSSKDKGRQDMETLAEINGHAAAAQKFPLPRAVFGASLEEAVYLTKPPGMEIALPSVVYRCIEYLNAKDAANEEGIFRLSGSNMVIRGLKERFNTGLSPQTYPLNEILTPPIEADFNLLAQDEYFDVHAIAGLLKLYLRELPFNILTSERREDFVRLTELPDKLTKIAALNELVHSLPIENFTLLKALSGHLLHIVGNSDINKMTIRNVGIVFSPTLNIPAQVFSLFLQEYHEIFFREGEPRSPTYLPHQGQGLENVPELDMLPERYLPQHMIQHPAGTSPAPIPAEPRTPFLPPPTPGFMNTMTSQPVPRTPMTSRPPAHLIPLPQTPAFPPSQREQQPRDLRAPSSGSGAGGERELEHPVHYEPQYEKLMLSPTTPRFQSTFETGAGGGGQGGLGVPGAGGEGGMGGQGGKGKSKRRESSMMFMKGLKSPMFGPPKTPTTSKLL